MYANPLAEMMKTDKKPDILSHLYQPFAQTTGAGESIIFLSLGKKSERGLQDMGLVETVEIRKRTLRIPTVPTSPDTTLAAGIQSKPDGRATDRKTIART